jgi:elongation factor Ts
MVKELRSRTGLGMMECKKALEEASGDMNKAEDLLRIRSGAKASKVAGRIAAEGTIGIHLSDDRKLGALVEVNCETDFVAKDQNFAGFAQAVAELAAAGSITDVEALALARLASGESVEARRQALVMKLGENISVRRVAVHKARGRLAHYLHGTRIGVMVDLEGGDETLGKDLAMHVAASSRFPCPGIRSRRSWSHASARSPRPGRWNPESQPTSSKKSSTAARGSTLQRSRCWASHS